MTGAAAAAYGITREKKAERPHAAIARSTSRRPNVILITSDQERSWDLMPSGFIETHCPARARLAERSISFKNAFTPSQLCSMARGTIYTGAHPQASAVWENVPIPYATDIRQDIATMGSLFQDAGYETAYCGKWHLSRLGKGGSPYPEDRVKEAVRAAGFDHPLTTMEVDGPWAGYRHDERTVGQALSMAARRGEEGKPLFMAVNLVNPHDIMYFAANDAMVRSQKVKLQRILPPPDDPLYAEDLGYDVFGSWGPATRKGKPAAVAEYARAYEQIFGVLPYDDEEIARSFQNYYWNAMRDCDRRLETLLSGLEAMGAMDDTIVVFTSDHGEFLGAHGLRGKGVTPYAEASRVPMLVSMLGGGSGTTEAPISHVDLVPTLLGLAGVDTAEIKSNVPTVVGQDLSAQAAGGSGLGPRADGVLVHWTSLAFIDHQAANAWEEVREREGLGRAYAYWKMQREELADAAEKRGQMRGITGSGYTFARYFSPKKHHSPQGWDELTGLNDIELYDDRADPNQVVNLAYDPLYQKKVLEMSRRLETLIAEEIGTDDGSFLPSFARS
ncbi:sulfatase-like hydrolase/transferase [Parvularcula sp. BGMRC 0090]|uniref:Sulfatase-like hydrolase/transferase n=2 Tax=Parvularcula maris TaxID=2965077 RepID=A0A9X2LA06_9PROT|nr:sulfatase-like hydrolase/transferase [Parvularcula maris]MCQ8185870.1 sulfatase-like hydrolase/transferase [Parvularcula maris]